MNTHRRRIMKEEGTEDKECEILKTNGRGRLRTMGRKRRDLMSKEESTGKGYERPRVTWDREREAGFWRGQNPAVWVSYGPLRPKRSPSFSSWKKWIVSKSTNLIHSASWLWWALCYCFLFLPLQRRAPSVPRPIKRLGQVGGLVIQRKEPSWSVKVLSKQDDFLKDSKGKEQTKKPHMKCEHFYYIHKNISLRDQQGGLLNIFNCSSAFQMFIHMSCLFIYLVPFSLVCLSLLYSNVFKYCR